MESVDQIRKARLAMLVAEFGGVTSIASAIKRSPSQVSQWLNSSPDSRTQKPRTISNASARYIEQQCLLKHGWMDHPIDGSEPKKLAAHAPANIEPGPDIRGAVPLISWVQAGDWSSIVDNFAPGDAEEWFPCPVSHGPRTYVLRVRGESMHNPHVRPSFADGDLIFVDPDRLRC
jgi:SOS-response transcriptional repressor LexA